MILSKIWVLNEKRQFFFISGFIRTQIRFIIHFSTTKFVIIINYWYCPKFGFWMKKDNFFFISGFIRTQIRFIIHFPTARFVIIINYWYLILKCCQHFHLVTLKVKILVFNKKKDNFCPICGFYKVKNLVLSWKKSIFCQNFAFVRSSFWFWMRKDNFCHNFRFYKDKN